MSVGPVLLANEVGRAVAAALKRSDPSVEVTDRGSYLRVAAERCTVTAEAVAAELGRPFVLPGDLEQVMPAFHGRLILREGAATWEPR